MGDTQPIVFDLQGSETGHQPPQSESLQRLVPSSDSAVDVLMNSCIESLKLSVVGEPDVQLHLPPAATALQATKRDLV